MKIINRALSFLVKLAGVAVTAPATYEAAQRFAHRYSLFNITIGGLIIDPLQQGVEIAAVLLVEGLFLLAWIRLDIEAESIGLQVADVAFAWAMYGVIFTIAIVQQEVTAVIVRIPIAIALAYQTWEKSGGALRALGRLIPKRNEDIPLPVRMHDMILSMRESFLYRKLRWKAFKASSKRIEDLHNEVLAQELALRQEKALRELTTEATNLLVHKEVRALTTGEGEVVYTTEQAVEWLKKNGMIRTEAWLRNLAASGKIGNKVNGRWLFSESELRNLLAQ